MEAKNLKSKFDADFDESTCSAYLDSKCLIYTDSKIHIPDGQSSSAVHSDAFAALNEEDIRLSNSSNPFNLSHSEADVNISSEVEPGDGDRIDALQHGFESHESTSPESQCISHHSDDDVTFSSLNPKEISDLDKGQPDMTGHNNAVPLTLTGHQVDSTSIIDFPEPIATLDLKGVSIVEGHSPNKFGEQSFPSSENLSEFSFNSSKQNCAKNDSMLTQDIVTDKPFDLNKSSPKSPDADCCECNTTDSPVLKESSALGASYEAADIITSEGCNVPTGIITAQPQGEHETPFKEGKLDAPEESVATLVSNLESDSEPNNEVDFLRREIEDLAKKLLRSQEQMESLLEEKQKWLTSLQQQQALKHKFNVSSDTAAIVVKFAQSEQQRMKAEARIKELEVIISRMKPVRSESPLPSEQCGPMQELNKALMEAREQVENLRHSLRQEETRVRDLNAKLNATREAHRSEQKRAAGQAEVINKLNRSIDDLKRQLQDMMKIREREAKRLCDEMTVRETSEKYNKALADIAALKGRIAELEEVKRSKSELEIKFGELQRAHDSLASVRDEMAACLERETQLSEFTRRLTERTAGLQSAHLAAQERLAASERAVTEASRAAREATELLQATEARARTERTEAADTIVRLEARICELIESEASLRADLTREQAEKAALKRKQHGLDRELARLVSQQRKRSIQQQNQPPSQLASLTSQKSDSTSENSPTGSNFSLSVFDAITTPRGKMAQDSLQPSALGNALLMSSVQENDASATTNDVITSMSTLEVHTLEPNKNLLLNKIDRLQRTNVRLMEKIDFMHEHISQLTQELQKKTKILQNSLFREAEDEGAAVPASADANKRQRMRRGGTLMAAVFTGDASIATSDLRTSLQLNKKLQSVLEDTLYKNLTLKENVDTLADEVARLKRANSELKTLVSAQNLKETALQR